MKSYSLTHLADHVLLRDLAALVSRDRATTSELLAHLAEVDERRLYLGAAYPSMYLYCVRELHLSEDAAFRRIHAARTARRFPAIFPALADGRLNLNSVLLLTPHLTQETEGELLGAAEHKTKAALELLLARRFPRPDVATLLKPLAPVPTFAQTAAGPVGAADIDMLAPRPDETVASQVSVQGVANTACQLALAPVGTHTAPAPPAPRARLAPLAPERFALQVAISQGTHDKLRYAQALLGHAVPSGDIATVLDRALDALVGQLERQRFAARARSLPAARRATGSRKAAPNPRAISASTRRTVWERDRGQCTFVSEGGLRCESRTRLEYDHVNPVARGGTSTPESLRLRCRAHNQYAAEQAFGQGFMRGKREEARRASALARRQRGPRAESNPATGRPGT